ncbi:MAG TPA: hypothetical protein VFL57_05030 [Bryobacteraceae bacterium]|nr:hypothetical protein [Bryobacteraceae bacterium]
MVTPLVEVIEARMQTLEKIAENVEKITIVGGLDRLLERTVTLRTE